MRRSHRRAHRVIWLILGPAVLVGFVLGVAARPMMPTQSAPVDAEDAVSEPPGLEAENR